MQMNMKYLLPCRAAIRKKKIDAFRVDLAQTQGSGNPLCGAEQMRTDFFVEFGQTWGMPVRNDENMTGIDWLKVHKGHATCIPMDNACWPLAGLDLAEEAVIHCLRRFDRYWPRSDDRGRPLPKCRSVQGSGGCQSASQPGSAWAGIGWAIR